METLPSFSIASPLKASRTGLPLQAGAGFKPQHLESWMADAHAPAFAEVHAENYMGAGGRAHAELTRLRERMPLSLHGVGLSIGGEGALDPDHLDRLVALIARYQPASFSEHLSWSTHEGVFLNDLLPLAYDRRTLDRVCAHVDQVQSRLRTRLLLENPSTYFEFEVSTWSEPEFLSQVVQRTGCGLLLDVNNVHVTCTNNGRDPHAYLDALPLQAVGEVHLAGHARHVDADGNVLLIDDHGAPVADTVWQLYVRTLESLGPVPTLVEWDTDVPHYGRLRAEVRHAQNLIDAFARNPGEVAA
jgi:hypothetical protein